MKDLIKTILLILFRFWYLIAAILCLLDAVSWMELLGKDGFHIMDRGANQPFAFILIYVPIFIMGIKELKQVWED